MPQTIENSKRAHVPITWREPFAFGQKPYTDLRPPGESVLEMVRSVPNLPREFWSRGQVCINGEPVAREFWGRVRPKSNQPDHPVGVTLHLPLGHPGASGGAAKSVISLVAAFALVVVTGGIAGGVLGPLGSLSAL